MATSAFHFSIIIKINVLQVSSQGSPIRDGLKKRQSLRFVRHRWVSRSKLALYLHGAPIWGSTPDTYMVWLHTYIHKINTLSISTKDKDKYKYNFYEYITNTTSSPNETGWDPWRTSAADSTTGAPCPSNIRYSSAVLDTFASARSGAVTASVARISSADNKKLLETADFRNSSSYARIFF